MSAHDGEKRTLRERVLERMRREGIPRGTDDPTLLALGARPLVHDDDGTGVRNPDGLTDEQYEAIYHQPRPPRSGSEGSSR